MEEKEKNEQEKVQKVEIVEKGTWATGKLIIGIISMVLFIIIAFQSCAAGLGNALEDNGSTSGSSGFFCALLMLIAGIITVATRNSKGKGGTITAAAMYFLGGLLALSETGDFADLAIWGALSVAFGLVNIGSIIAAKGKIKNVILIIGIIAISVIILIVGSNSSDKNNNTESNSSQKETNKKTYKQGETVTYKGVNYTVTDVKYSNGSEWDTPTSGKEYVIVKVKIENKSNKKVSYNTYDWKMRNSQGQEEETTFTSIDENTNLDSGDLAVNGTKEGTIVFEEPKNDSSLKLLYFDNSLFDEEESFEIIIK